MSSGQGRSAVMEHLEIPVEETTNMAAFKKIGKGEFQTELPDSNDMQMWGIIYIGSDKQPMSVMMDTGSPWVWSSAKSCTTCPGKYTFDSSTSTTFKAPGGWNDKNLGYGSGIAKGPVVHDTWCIGNDKAGASCYKNMKFVNAKSTTLSILKCSGLIGLSPMPSSSGATDLFIDKMKEAGIIDKKIFSFSIGMGAYKNQMTFGGYDVAKFG